MKPRRPTLALAVLALAALGVWLALRNPDAPPSLAEPPPSAADPDPTPRSAAVGRNAVPAPAPAPAAAPRPAGPATAGPGGAVEPANGPLRGTVREFGGGPAPAIKVEVVDADGEVVAAAVTDAEGRFQFAFEDAPPGAHLETRDVAATGPRVRHPIGPARAGGSLVLSIPAPGVVAGTVVDAAGRPVAGAVVTSDRKNTAFPPRWRIVDGEAPELSQSSTTDVAGRFRLPFLLRGRQRLRAEAEERTGTVDVVVDTGVANATVVLGTHAGSAVVAVDGRLIDGLTGDGVPGAVVFANRVQSTPGGLSEATVARATTDADGRFALRGLEPGAFRLTTRPAGYAPLAGAVAEYDDGLRTVDLTVFPARAVTVRVLQPSGAPYPKVELRAVDAEGDPITMLGRGRIPTASVRADDRGTVRLRGLPARRLTLVAVAGDLLPAGRVDVDLTEVPTGDVEIRMPCERPGRTRNHYFVLQGPEGKPAVIDGTVVAEAFDGDRLVSHVEGRVRADGKFVFGHEEAHDFDVPTIAVAAPRGACTVRIRVPGYWEVTHPLEVGAPSPTTIALRR